MNYALIIFALMLSACSTNPPTQFYMLNAEPGAEAGSTSAFNKDLVVGLGPVHIPEYLNRSQIVIGLSENQYRFDENHRWAERLDQNIGRTLAQFLRTRLGVDQIVKYPWPQRQPIDFQVSIDIFEFHQSADGHSRLLAQWQIKHLEQVSLSKQFECSIASKDEIEAIVKSQSSCLAQLGMAIESGLRQLATH